jgi:crotonobetainyl-CoA:carnitine CoA-transferase CaiB-like acyl-CoA transferase
MEQLSGLSHITGATDGPPTTINGPMDPIAGTHATIALLLALEHRRRTGEGMLVEAIMLGGALALTAEQVIEHSSSGRLLSRTGNRGPAAAPQGLYRTADVDEHGHADRWVAIAVETDEQWQALRAALGQPAWADHPDLTSMEGRRAHHDELDERLAAWCADRSSQEVVDVLWSEGVPVGKALLPHELGSLEQLWHRGFYETVTHPLVGATIHQGYPVRFSAGPARLHRRAAPTLGQHNREILSELLELSDDDIRALEEEQVIGDRLLGAFRPR